jgi:hypothetical protein
LLNAGADTGEVCGLFVDTGVDAHRAQRDRGSEAADAGAGDGDAEHADAFAVSEETSALRRKCAPPSNTIKQPQEKRFQSGESEGTGASKNRVQKVAREEIFLNWDSPDGGAIRRPVTSFRLNSQGAGPRATALAVSGPTFRCHETARAGGLLIWAQFSRRGSSVR